LAAGPVQALPRELLPQALQAGRHAGAVRVQGRHQPVRRQAQRAQRAPGRPQAPPAAPRQAPLGASGGREDNPRMAIETVSPSEARRRQGAGAVLVDVREAHERASGMAEGALGAALGGLLDSPADTLPDPEAEIVLICESGKRSLEGAAGLLEAGYRRVASVDGGTRAWRA